MVATIPIISLTFQDIFITPLKIRLRNRFLGHNARLINRLPRHPIRDIRSEP